ncbi:MAG: M28 family peptidase [Caldilineae bacterium]|nr:MAG: M28 family peptidase [Caldilineae bacterium]
MPPAGAALVSERSWRRPRLDWITLATVGVLVLALGYLGWLGTAALPEPTPTPVPPPVFDGDRALALAQYQCEIGPRPTGSPAGRQTGDWIIEQLQLAGWTVETQEFTHNGVTARNIVAKAGRGDVLLLGAHYDTRLVADRDPDTARRNEPVLGANDGASGVAVLLELARALDVESMPHEVWLAFFDAEDNGDLEGWDWALGSRYMAENLESLPRAMILLDMVGDADQRFLWEGNSDPQLRQHLWQTATILGYKEYFVPEVGPTLIDDHVAFLERGVPAVDIVDFEYPPWHTTADTCDKLSAESLGRVGRLLEIYLERGLIRALQ